MFLRLLLLVSFSVLAPAQHEVLRGMDARAEHFGRISRQIWELAETGFRETRSAALLAGELRAAGFAIEEKIGGMPTAFIASWGSGKPVIAIMGEYDALPGLSQEAIPEKKPRVAGGAGHGCGHNLFGTAAALAAITVKEQMEARKLAGAIRFCGTPAEEGGGGKIFMARAGAFRDVDAAITWHPGNSNSASLRSCLAVISGRFRFYGRAAHAAAAPEMGRSAADAALLFLHAVEMLREHVPDSTRIHHFISSGGTAANIVPDFAEVQFTARHPEMAVLDGIWERILKCAQGAAIATETRTESEIYSNYNNILPNDTLTMLLDKNLRIVGGVSYTPEERAFAEKMRGTMPGILDPLGTEAKILSLPEGVDSYSTDVGDISWLLPTAHFWTATFAPGIPLHSWQSTACAGMSIGRKGMMVAAKTLALTALDLITDPKKVLEARASFEKRKGGKVYRSRLPEGMKPPLNYRDK